MIKYTLMLLFAVSVGWAVAEVPYYLDNHPAPVKHNQVSFEERILKAGDRIERLLILDALREEARG